MARQRVTNFGQTIPNAILSGMQLEEQKKARLAQEAIQKQRNIIDAGTLELGFKQFALEFINGFSGVEITPEQKETAQKQFIKLWNHGKEKPDPETFESLFAPNEDKTSYTLSSTDSLLKGIEIQQKEYEKQSAEFDKIQKQIENKTGVTATGETGESIVFSSLHKTDKWQNATVEDRYEMDLDLKRKLPTNVEGISQGAMTQLDKDMITLIETLNDIELANDTFIDDAYTLTGKTKFKWAVFKDFLGIDVKGLKVSDEEKEYIQQVQNHISAVQSLFQKTRQEYTGAQAAIKELEELMNDFMSKKHTPTEARGLLKQMADKTKKMLRIKRYIKRNGTTLTDDTINKMVGSYFGPDGGADPTLDPNEIAIRSQQIFDQIKSARTKMSDEQIRIMVHDQMYKEGYMF